MAYLGRYDWSTSAAEPTRLLKELDNPLHIAIVQNYRRHYLLEMAGRYKEIFTPEMSVPTPELDYNYSIKGVDGPVRGQQVVDLYANTHLQVFAEHEHLAVHDWGIASESIMHQYSTGGMLRGAGIDVDSADDWYIMTYKIGMFWHYTDRARMIGENCYHQFWTIDVEKAPADEPTKEQINQELDKLIALYEPEWRATLLP